MAFILLASLCGETLKGMETGMTLIQHTIKTCAILAMAALPFGAVAQTAEDDQGAFLLELNNAANTNDGGCRLTYVAANQSDLAFDRTAIQVGIFDADGVVTRLLLLEFGALIAGKTKILQFDLAGQTCDEISRIVVNDTAACTLSDGGGESDFCATRIEAGSRTAIQFGL